VLYKDTTDQELRDAYWALRGIIDLDSKLCSPRNMSRNLRHLDIIVAISRKRGIRL